MEDKIIFKQLISRKQTFIWIVFLFLSIVLLLFTHIGRSEMYGGDDILFHLSRIEGLVKGIRHGDLFPKINYFFLDGMGYISPVFYSDIFLYPAALLRLIGFSRVNAYILFLLGVNFVTYVVAYHSFLFYKKSARQAFVFAVLYGSASYRLSDLTERAALGELLGLIFVPVVFVGLWTIFYGKSSRFYILSIGMSGLLLTHMLSAVICSLFIFLYIILNIDVFFENKYRLIDFVKAVFLTILLTIGFLLPMLEQSLNQSLNFQTHPVFQFSDSAGSIIDYFKTALVNNGYNNLGILIILLFAILVLRINRLNKQSKQLIILVTLFLIFSTNLIPYGILNDSILNVIQFPWRFFLIVTFGVCWVFADNMDSLFYKKKTNQLLIYGSLGATLLLVVLHGSIISDSKYASKSYIETMHISTDIGYGREYLPSGMDARTILREPQASKTSEKLVIGNILMKYGAVELDYQVDGEGQITLPFVYYKGYQAFVDDKPIEIYKSRNTYGLSEVKVTGSGHLKFFYKWTIIQRISVFMSVLTWIILLSRKWLMKYIVRVDKG